MDKIILDNYNSQQGADKYTKKFNKHWWERLNNQTEQKLVTKLLTQIPRQDLTGTSLDMPCGYGRLYPLIRSVAPKVIEGDWSFHLLKECQNRTAVAPGLEGKSAPNVIASEARQSGSRDDTPPPDGFTRGTALNFPFKDHAFDLVQSIRLCHHISTEHERLQYLSELCRIANKYILFSYFDTDSIKNRIHATKIKWTGKRPKWTLTLDQVERKAKDSGFEILKSVPLSRFFSGHQYTLMKRTNEAE
jgi:SAM-dependent methyltransferase